MSSEYPQSLRLFELVLWVVAVGGAIVSGSVVIGLAMEGGFTIAKRILFVVGFLLFGVSSFMLRPKPPKGEDDDGVMDVDEPDETRIEGYLQQVPPLRDNPIPADQRVNRNVKLFLVSIAVLATSFLMETVFGVTP
jgi:hypothetical protein